MLHGLERGLAAQPIPAAIERAAYYFSNFDLQLDAIRDTGKLQTMFPVDFVLPMVAPRDLGRVAARRLMSAPEDVGVIQIEGPARHTPADVARAFAAALGRPVQAVATPREGWVQACQAQGFSAPAADSYARMTAASVDQPLAGGRGAGEGRGDAGRVCAGASGARLTTAGSSRRRRQGCLCPHLGGRTGGLRGLDENQKVSYEIERDRRSDKESAGQLKTAE